MHEISAPVTPTQVNTFLLSKSFHFFPNKVHTVIQDTLRDACTHYPTANVNSHFTATTPTEVTTIIFKAGFLILPPPTGS